jgi:hypothetical protein
MFDADEKAGSNGRRILWISLCGLGMIIILGAIAGHLSAHIAEGGGPLNIAGYAVLAALMSVTLALAFVIWRLFRQMKRSGEKVPRREKVYNRYWLGTVLFSGLIGAGMALAQRYFGAKDAALFASGPLLPAFAIIYSIIIGVIGPAITFYWHKYAVDEQEEAAYRFGALIAAYAFVFLTPLWLLLWQGGLLPEPNIVAMYFLFSMVWTIVWLWKKYH